VNTKGGSHDATPHTLSTPAPQLATSARHSPAFSLRWIKKKTTPFDSLFCLKAAVWKKANDEEKRMLEEDERKGRSW
jgi:hypothetical protein